MRLLAEASRDSPGSSEQVAVNGWLGRADRRYSKTFAPPPPGRPVFTLWSSAQGVHVHRTNIASVALARGSRWRCIGPHFVVWSKQTSVRIALLRSVRVKRAPAQIGGRQISAGHVGVAENCPCRLADSKQGQLAMSFLIARNTLSVRRPTTAFSSSKRFSGFHHATW
jgi:hypothetical protein